MTTSKIARILVAASAIALAAPAATLVDYPLESLGGIALGAGSLYLLAFLYEKWKKVEGMGMGDVKMLGMIGSFLGPWGVVVAVAPRWKSPAGKPKLAMEPWQLMQPSYVGGMAFTVVRLPA